MKFKVCTAADLYSEVRAQKLRALGFVFRVNEHDKTAPCFKINDKVEVEIGTLEELIAFAENYGALIVTPGEIEIYDYYRE